MWRGGISKRECTHIVSLSRAHMCCQCTSSHSQGTHPVSLSRLPSPLSLLRPLPPCQTRQYFSRGYLTFRCIVHRQLQHHHPRKTRFSFVILLLTVLLQTSTPSSDAEVDGQQQLRNCRHAPLSEPCLFHDDDEDEDDDEDDEDDVYSLLQETEEILSS